MPSTAKLAIFCLFPEGTQSHRNNLMNDLLKASTTISEFCKSFDFEKDTWEISWKVPEGMILDAIKSIPRHLKHTNPSLQIHLVLFSHGFDGQLCFTPNVSSQAIIETLIGLKMLQLQTVSLLACQSLKGIQLPKKLPFNLLGFREDIYTNELLFFTARLLYWYSICSNFGESIKHAQRYALITSKSIVYRNKNL